MCTRDKQTATENVSRWCFILYEKTQKNLRGVGGATTPPVPPALEHAQAAHEHTEQPTTQLESVSFVDAISAIEWLVQQSFNWPFGY